MKLIAAKNTVILEAVGQQMTKSGVAVPEAQGKGAPEIGKVLEIGSGKKPLAFEVGDEIIYRRYMENKIFVRAKDFNFIDFKDILAVIVEDEEVKPKDENN